jgi:hypothetical protein
MPPTSSHDYSALPPNFPKHPAATHHRGDLLASRYSIAAME